MTKTKKYAINRILAVLALLFSAGSMSVYAQIKIGDNPTAINPNSLLELESSNKGLLLPRLGLDSTSSFAPLAAHVAGMVVYNMDSSGTGTTGVTPGFYYNDGTQWVRLDAGGDAWQLLGNASTNPGAAVLGSPVDGNFLGTTDAQDLVLATNGTKWAVLNQQGSFTGGYGTSISANNSIAWGASNTVGGSSNIAVGNSNTLEDYAYTNAAFGSSNTIMGSAYTNIVSGNGNVIAGSAYSNSVFGNFNYASSGTYSSFIAGQMDSVINGYGNAVTGGNNTVSGISNIVGGSSNKLYETNGSAVFGSNNIDSASYSFVTGLNNSLAPTATTAVVIGDGNRVSGRSSGAVGEGNTVTRDLSYAFGIGNVVSNATAPASYVSSFAAGIDNRVLGHSSAAFGQQNTLNSQHSFAAGYANSALSNASVVFGYSNTAPAPGGFVAGVGNAFITSAGGPNTLALNDPHFQIGNGFSPLMNNARQNAFTVLFNGYTAIGSHTVKPTHTLEVNGQAKIDTLLTGTAADRIVLADAAGVLKAIPQTQVDLRMVGTNNHITMDAGVGGNGTGVGTGSRNVALGESVMGSNVNGVNNFAAGFSSMLANTSGSSNIAIGWYSLLANTTGNFNNALGNGSLESNTTGSGNVAYGTGTLRFLASGSNNVAIGQNAGTSQTSGNGNIFIGNEADFNVSATSSNQLNIGNWIYGDNGQIGIAKAIPTSTLDVNGSIATSLRIVTANDAFGATDYTLLKTGAAPATISLPPASSCPGRMYRLVEFAGNGNTSTVTISPAVQTYDGVSQYATTGFWEIHTNLTAAGTNGGSHSVTFQSDGTNWYALGR